jgi:hypothetical protein
MAQNDYGGWLQWMDGEGGQSQAQGGAKSAVMSMFDPAILAKYGLGSGDGMTWEQLAAMGQASGLDYRAGERENGGTWVDLLHNGKPTGDRSWQKDTPDSAMDKILPLMFAAATGAALGFYDLPGFLTGGAGSGAGAAAAGGEIAGLAAGQVGAMGGAGAGALTGVGTLAVPEIATLASTLGADYGVGQLLASAGTALGGAGLGSLAGVESMAALEPLTGVGSLGVEAIPTLSSTLGADFGVAELTKLAGSALAPAGGSSAAKNAMYGSEGYGPGMTGAQTSAYDSVLGATGSKTLADLAANSSIGSSLINGVSGVADLVGGGKNLAGLIGAVAGASEGGGTTTKTGEQKIDPRMAQYLYGTGYGDPNSVLGAAQNLWKQNPSGINPTMQQGMDMTKAALTDPAYSQGYQAMRNAGVGLLGQGVAANPFTSGNNTGLLNMGTPQAGGAGGLMNIDPNAAQNLMKVGRGLLPNRT